MDQARQYLQRIVSWDANVNLHWCEKKENLPNPIWLGKPVRSVDEAIRQIVWLNNRPQVTGIFACMSSQREVETRVSPRTGNPYTIARRESSNASMLRSLFLDVDVGKKDKNGNPVGYQSEDDALGHIYSLGDLLGIYPTAVVASGNGGFHVYWTLKDTMAAPEWQGLADALCAAAQQYGLEFDSQCTIDCVRILRIPNTVNRKLGQENPVYFYYEMTDPIPNADMSAALAPYVGLHVSTPKGNSNANAASNLQDEFTKELLGGVGKTGAALRSIDQVSSVCAFIWDTLDTAGRDWSNPLWFLSLASASFCTDPEATAHRLSSGHPGYHPDETALEIARLLKDRQTKQQVGFPSCRAIDQAGAPQCKSCPLFSLGKSPLSVPGAMPQAQPQATGTALTPAQGYELPEGYFSRPDKLVAKLLTNEDGTQREIIVFPYPLLDPWVSVDPFTLNFVSTYKGGEALHVSIEFEAMADKQATTKALLRAGLPTQVSNESQEFWMSFLKKLQESALSVVDATPFGWSEGPKGVEGFTFGGRCWTPTGVKPGALPEQVLRAQYTPKGNTAIWLEAAKLITDQQRPALDVILASAFAAPLVSFSGQKGIAVGAYSLESGIGKTTALQIAQAVWGHPVKAVQGLDDTQNALFRRVGQLRHLPVYYDEIKTGDQQNKVVNLLFQLSGGKEKARATRSAKLADGGSWNTMLFYASNESLRDAVSRQTRATVAGHVRLFEYVVPPAQLPQGGVGKVARLVGRLEENYGAIGLEYAKWIGENFERVDQDVQDMIAAIEKLAGAKTEERMWIAAVATLALGAKYANQLGFVTLNGNAMLRFLLDELEKMRQMRRETDTDLRQSINVITTLGHFLNEKRAEHTLFTDRVWISATGHGRPPKNSIKILNKGYPAIDRTRALQVQIGMENKILRITYSALAEWLKLKNIPTGAFLEAMRGTFPVSKAKAIIGAGSEKAVAAENLWELNFAGTELEDHLDLAAYVD